MFVKICRWKVREVANPGANVAPWNVQKYDISKKGGKILINTKWPLIYYHYHSFKMNLKNYDYMITGDRHNNYEINKDVINIIYKPYIVEMIKVIKRLKQFSIYKEYVNKNPEGNYHINK